MEEFFGRNYLVEINKELMFWSRFGNNFVSRQKEDRRTNFNPKKCDAMNKKK